MSKKGMKLMGVGIVGLVLIGVIGFVVYKKVYKPKLEQGQANAITMGIAGGSSPGQAVAQASRATYYNPYSYNARHALMSSISPYYRHKGYFSAPQHSVGNYNNMGAFSFDRDDEA